MTIFIGKLGILLASTTAHCLCSYVINEIAKIKPFIKTCLPLIDYKLGCLKEMATNLESDMQMQTQIL